MDCLSLSAADSVFFSSQIIAVLAH